jgi:hypothetical protein
LITRSTHSSRLSRTSYESSWQKKKKKDKFIRGVPLSPLLFFLDRKEGF